MDQMMWFYCCSFVCPVYHRSLLPSNNYRRIRVGCCCRRRADRSLISAETISCWSSFHDPVYLPGAAMSSLAAPDLLTVLLARMVIMSQLVSFYLGPNWISCSNDFYFTCDQTLLLPNDEINITSQSCIYMRTQSATQFANVWRHRSLCMWRWCLCKYSLTQNITRGFHSHIGWKFHFYCGIY